MEQTKIGQKKFEGLVYYDEPVVEVISYSVPAKSNMVTGNEANIVLPAEIGARLCYNSFDKLGQDTDGFLKRLADRGHDTIWETIHVSVLVRGCSRIFTHQIITHRHISKLQFSTRYNDEFCFVIPAGLPKHLSEMLLGEYKKNLYVYNQMKQAMKLNGVSNKEQKEYARYCLPEGMEAPIMLSGNMHAWRDVFKRRLQKDVSPETYNVVLKIYEKIKELSPVLVYPIEPK